MKISKHYPAYCQEPPSIVEEFSNIDELLEIPFVKEWKDKPAFYRYSISDNILMAELFGGTEWWVIGYIDECIDGWFPEWLALDDPLSDEGRMIETLKREIKKLYYLYEENKIILSL